MDAVAPTTKTQEAVDRFYVQHGPCCAGCDWWAHINSLIGECRKSAPVSADQRYSMVRMDRISWQLRGEPEAGHILTNREHHCGDFKDAFDWPSLPPAYLRRIGWEQSTPRRRADMDNVIDVCCIAAPDGRAFWCEPDPEIIANFWANWRASLPAEKFELYEQRGCCGGMVKIRMLESDYRAIGATNESAALFGATP